MELSYDDVLPPPAEPPIGPTTAGLTAALDAGSGAAAHQLFGANAEFYGRGGADFNAHGEVIISALPQPRCRNLHELPENISAPDEIIYRV